MNPYLRKIGRILLKPAWIEYCSQTLYESLSFCNNMYIITNDDFWKNKGLDITEIIREIQQEDGGFDIGYKFNFGKIHKKGWSSAPECKMLVPLIEFGAIFGFDKVIDIIEKGIDWIKENSIKIDDEKWAIPYCPMATTEIMVYNGISFALAPLAMYYRHINQDEKIKEIHDGYINYLYEEFEWNNGYLKYFDQKRKGLTDIQKVKIDNYHLGQQLEMHCQSYNCLENLKNNEMINRMAEYLLILHNENIPCPLPYFNYTTNNEIGVHLWGYSSLINGFLRFNQISNDERYLLAAKQIFDWINKYTWTNSHFICIYFADQNKVDNRFYPRSDAWVINNLSSYIMYTSESNFLSRLEENFQKIESQNFSGFENHASTNMNKIVNWIYTNIIKKSI